MKRSIYFLSILAGCGLYLTGCSDDSDTGKTNDTNHGCQCEVGQICDDHGECIEDPNIQKPDDQDKPDACDNQCTSEQTCQNGQCVDKENPIPEQCRPGCGADQTCTESGCIDNSKICDPACTGDRECVQNQCEFTCDVHCGESCCAEGEACDTITNEC
ncbi:MAG: hypothetical protein J6A01_00670, partial [Proteobacteria bacterium]|nr:hypothetical protein [Pseudomonadota bacterium]